MGSGCEMPGGAAASDMPPFWGLLCMACCWEPPMPLEPSERLSWPRFCDIWPRPSKLEAGAGAAAGAADTWGGLLMEPCAPAADTPWGWTGAGAACAEGAGMAGLAASEGAPPCVWAGMGLLCWPPDQTGPGAGLLTGGFSWTTGLGISSWVLGRPWLHWFVTTGGASWRTAGAGAGAAGAGTAGLAGASLLGWIGADMGMEPWLSMLRLPIGGLGPLIPPLPPRPPPMLLPLMSPPLFSLYPPSRCPSLPSGLSPLPVPTRPPRPRPGAL
mmetsp:Transcript_26989/g.65649  ORF Transcript_26989/g.65649 Transcript_26989/m.65649 type:complete len:271 (-) Transcript_26989:261-1073(-)